MTNLALKLEPAETALTFIQDGQVLTNSKTVASVFNKRHCDVLEAIKRLEIPEDLRKRNFPLTFNEVKMPNGAIRKDPCYNLTKDGFVLLVMGFTGKKAMAFKIKYIEAFNAMERALAAVPALDAKAIGGIVKKCAAKAVKDEIANVRPAPFKVATAYERKAFVDEIKQAVKDALWETINPCILQGGVKKTPLFNGYVTADGLPPANWILGIIHGANALECCINRLVERQKDAVNLLEPKQ